LVGGAWAPWPGHAQGERRGKGRIKRGGGVSPRVCKKEENRERVTCNGVHDQRTKFRRERSKPKNWRKREKRGVVWW
jgi:hypothetical protein